MRFVVLALVLGAAAPASAQVVLDRVVAVVNDDAIFLSELRDRAAPYLGRAMTLPTSSARDAAIESVYEQMLDVVINHRLIEQAAERDGITVSDADVDDAIGTLSASSGLSGSAFWNAVASQGFATPAAFREDVRDQLLRYRVLNARVRSRVSITEEDVRARYDALVGTGARVGPYADVWQDIYREMLSDAMERQQERFIEELRRDAVIERR